MNNLILNDDVIGTKRNSLSFIFIIIGIFILILSIIVFVLFFTIFRDTAFINKIFILISGFSLVFLSGLFSYFGIIKLLDSKKGNYLIVEDTIKSKNTITDDITGTSTYFINFELLDRYDIQLTVEKDLYERGLVGSKVYLVFFKGINIPNIYMANNTTLDDSIKNKLVIYNDIVSYCNLKEKK